MRYYNEKYCRTSALSMDREKWWSKGPFWVVEKSFDAITKTELRAWQRRTADLLIDPDKARQLFEMIQKTGIERPRKVAP